MSQNLLTGGIAQNVCSNHHCLSFFPTITSKYVYQLSEKTHFLSVFNFLGLRPLEILIFKKLDIYFMSARTVGSSLY